MNIVCCISFFRSLEYEVQASKGLQFHHQCDLLARGTWSFIFLSKVKGIKKDKKFQPFSPLHCLLDDFCLQWSCFWSSMALCFGPTFFIFVMFVFHPFHSKTIIALSNNAWGFSVCESFETLILQLLSPCHLGFEVTAWKREVRKVWKQKKKGKIKVTNWELQALSTITKFWPSISFPFKLFFTFCQIHFVFFLWFCEFLFFF